MGNKRVVHELYLPVNFSSVIAPLAKAQRGGKNPVQRHGDTAIKVLSLCLHLNLSPGQVFL